MGVWDYITFIGIILVLFGLILLLRRSEKKSKNQYKLNAYRLLDTPDPTRKEISKAIRLLRLYGGTWRKDKEFVELANRLSRKLDKLES